MYWYDSAFPKISSTAAPSVSPTASPVQSSAAPTLTNAPTIAPTNAPTINPSHPGDTNSPSCSPSSSIPTYEPSVNDTTTSLGGDSDDDGPSGDGIARVFTFLTGTVVLILGVSALFLRSPYTSELNELGPTAFEGIDLVLKSLNISLALNTLYTSGTSAASNNTVFPMILASRLIIAVFWVVFVILFSAPVRLFTSMKVVHLSVLLNKQAIRFKMSLTLYACLVTVGVLDLTLLRLLPWSKSLFTLHSKGYPDLLSIRVCMYGTVLSSFIQTVSLIPVLIFGGSSSNFDIGMGKSMVYLFFAISIFNTVRSFIAMILYIQMAVLDDMDMVLVTKRESQPSHCAQDLEEAGGNVMMTVSVDRMSGESPFALADVQVVPPPIMLEPEPALAAAIEDARIHAMQADATYTDERGIRFSAEHKFADQTLEVLRNQLRQKGEVPLEFIPLADLKAELAQIFACANSGEAYDENRLDFLLLCMDSNPEYKQEQELEKMHWREEVEPFAKDCLRQMRGFVPPNIFHASASTLAADGMSPALVKRIMTKKCLWLVRIPEEDIGKIHIAELSGRFNPEAQGLDIVEVGALYACIPAKLPNDSNGRKERWKSSIDANLKNLYKQMKAGTLGKGPLFRHPAYKGHESLYDPAEVAYVPTVVEPSAPPLSSEYGGNESLQISMHSDVSKQQQYQDIISTQRNPMAPSSAHTDEEVRSLGSEDSAKAKATLANLLAQKSSIRQSNT